MKSINRGKDKALMLYTRLLYIGILYSVLLLTGCAVKTVQNPEDVLSGEEVLPVILEVLEHGDWLVNRGIQASDNAVATLTNMPFSHAAIYDAENVVVIEADSSGVHSTPLTDFIAKSTRVMVVRPSWSNETNSKEAVLKVRSWVGQGYDFTGLVGLPVAQRYYCTELVILAYTKGEHTKPENAIPLVIAPGQIHHWGKIIFDTGPITKQTF